jgi:hypothetical protein
MVAPVPQPLGYTESEQQAAKGNAHQRHNEREPTGVGAGAGARESAKHGDQKQRREQTGSDGQRAGHEKFACAIAGPDGDNARRTGRPVDRGHSLNPAQAAASRR